MTFVSTFKPLELWQHFDQILTIPRGSKNEEAARKYVISIADKNGLRCRQDSTGNVVVFKPAAPGRESAPIVVLQAHLDMVNEKNSDVDHDFTRDPIRPLRAGEYLTATGTTLGADNGIGVAAELAMLETSDVDHGPLELLFTVDEETGLTGAAGLEAGFLKGKRLINLDTEEDGAIYVGCAGGTGVDLALELEFESVPAGYQALRLQILGLKGGHSGGDIHLQRGNAIKILSRALAALRTSFRLADLRGGNMRNAIPREASAVVAVPRLQVDGFRQELDGLLQAVASEIHVADPGMRWEVGAVDAPPSVLGKGLQRTAIDLLNGLPHGVAAMSLEMPGLVETSGNLATVAISEGRLQIHVSNRSSVASALEGLCGQVASIGSLAGASVSYTESYPGWRPNLDSELLAVARKVMQRELGKEPQVKAVHAGLECGLIGKTFPDMDMISIGPEIEFPHSPDERVRIDSVAEFWGVLSALLEEIAVSKPHLSQK